MLELIGKGGMGSVFKVRDLEQDLILAIKVLRSDLVSNQAALKRFELEISALSRLTHSNLVTVYGHDYTADGAPFLIMEYISGQTLSQILEAERCVQPERTMSFIAQICEGLSHAHAAGIVHRDIKPTNILVTGIAPGPETVKIVDFGIATIMQSEPSADITATSDVIGTPDYMSPEQCGGTVIDQRSDIYSLGCIMYEMLTGRPPFSGENPIQVAVKHISETPPPFPQIAGSNKGMMNRLQSITSRCLEKDPDYRYQRANEVRSDILRVANRQTTLMEHRPPERQRFRRLIESSPALLVCTLMISISFIMASEGSVLMIPEQLNNGAATMWFCIVNLLGALMFTKYVLHCHRMLGTTTVRRTYHLSALFGRQSALFEACCGCLTLWSVVTLFSLPYLGVDLGSGLFGYIASSAAIVFLSSYALLLLTITSGVVLQLRHFVEYRQQKKGGAKIEWVDFIINHKKTVSLRTLLITNSIIAILCSLFLTTVPTFMLAHSMLISNRAPNVSRAIVDSGKLFYPSDHPLLSSLRAMLDIRMQKLDKALLELNKCMNGLEKHKIPDYEAGAYFQYRGRVHEELGNYSAAISDYTKAIELDPSDVHRYRRRASNYVKTKDYGNAINDLKRALTAEENDDFARLAIAYELAGDQRNAHQTYSRLHSRIANSDDKLLSAFVYDRLARSGESRVLLEDASRQGLRKEDLVKRLFSDKSSHIQFRW